MHYFQVPELVTSQPGLQAPVYQTVHGASSQGHLEGVGQTFGMLDANFLNVPQNGEGSVRPQEVAAQDSSWHYEPLLPVNVDPGTLTLNEWHQRHSAVNIIPHYPVNTLIQVPHSTHSCNFQPVGMNGHVQYPGLIQIQNVPTTELHNTRGQMFFQPTVYMQRQQQLPIINQIPPGSMYPNNFSWTHHAMQARETMRPPYPWKSLTPVFNNRDVPQEYQTAMTIMNSKVTPVEYRAGVHSHLDRGSKISQELTKNIRESTNKRKDSLMCGTLEKNNIQQNAADDTKHFFRWDNKQTDPTSTKYSDGSKPATCFNKGHTTLRCEQLEPLLYPNTLLSPRDIFTDQDAMVPAISPGMSSNTKNKNVPHRQKRSAIHILGSLAEDLLSCDYEDPEVSMLISSMDYFYQVSPYVDIQRKKENSLSAPLSSNKRLAKWYSIFKKRRLCRLKAKVAKHPKI